MTYYLPIWWLFAPRALAGTNQKQSECDKSRANANRLKCRTPDPATASRIVTRDPELISKDDMGDLQSPHYVKRTATMFDARYSGELNGSSPIARSNGNGVTSPTLGQPSYVSVSRSVCGYSCLSYSNGNGVSPTPASNGTSHVIKAPIPLRPFASPTVSVSPKPKFASNAHHQSMPGEAKHESNGSSPYQYNKANSYMESSPEPECRIGSYRDGETADVDNGHGINNYTQNRCKSNILEKIERLYGANAVKSTSLWRRPVPASQEQSEGPKVRKSYPLYGADSEYSRLPASNGRNSERIIPILVESSDTKLKNGSHKITDYSCERESVKRPLTSPETIQNSSYPPGSKFETSAIDLYSNYVPVSAKNEQESKNRLPSSSVLPAEPPKLLSDNLYSDVITNKKLVDSVRSETSSSELYSNFESSKADKSIHSTENSSSILHRDSRTPETLPQTEEPVSAAMATDVLSKQLAHKTEENDAIDGDTTLIQGMTRVMSLEQPSTKAEDVPTDNASSSEVKNVEKGGLYFLGVLDSEKAKIQKLIDDWETRLAVLEKAESGGDSEMSGKVWAAIGKAKLLINKKFKQFEGLCKDNIEQKQKGVNDSEPFTTKDEDLEGFWDMMYIQVDQIHEMFRDLDGKPSASVGSPKKSAPKKSTAATKGRTPQTKPTSVSETSKTKSSAVTARDELRRKMLAEKRRAMKDQVTKEEQQTEAEVQIFIPES